MTTVIRDGHWIHFDNRPTENAVVHAPTLACPFSGRHPEGDCALVTGRNGNGR